MMPTEEYCAKVLNEVIKHAASKEAVFEDISCFGSDEKTLNLVAAYETSI